MRTRQRLLTAAAVAGAIALAALAPARLDGQAVATACVVVADMLGVCLMLPKTWRDPSSETLATYALASAAGFLSMFAVGGLDLSLLLYPISFFVANGLIAVVIIGRTRALRPAGSLLA